MYLAGVISYEKPCGQWPCFLHAQIKGLPVYGVAIPTVLGLRNVFGAMNAQNGETLKLV